MRRFLLLLTLLFSVSTVSFSAVQFKVGSKYRLACKKYADQGSVVLGVNHSSTALLYYDLTATADTPTLVGAATRLADSVWRQGIYYKRAGVMVAAITDARAIQPDLFTYNPERRRRLDSVTRAMDTINGRLGADTVVTGAQQYRQLAPDGKTIKFVNAIRRARKSPDYTTRLGAFVV